MIVAVWAGAMTIMPRGRHRPTAVILGWLWYFASVAAKQEPKKTAKSKPPGRNCCCYIRNSSAVLPLFFQILDVDFPLQVKVMNIHPDFHAHASENPVDAAFGDLDSSQKSARSCRVENQSSKKKRSKLIRIDLSGLANCSGVVKAKPVKRVDPSAPKITQPCTECGKKFWSWKALFGHMRCHPERQWRGINPPPNFWGLGKGAEDRDSVMSDDDHEVAACLLIMANGTAPGENISPCMVECEGEGEGRGGGGDRGGAMGGSCRFECSSCKKVFGSHQALGGHRASHKNVKGCFAITRNEGEDDRDGDGESKENMEEKMVMVLGHKCSICLRVFTSGQALGGHKRCHWERGDEQPSSSSSLFQGLNSFPPKPGLGLDLNLPAPLEDDACCSPSSNLALDLRLGL